ncbi:hypothetical protein ACHAXT_000272 [Thalassiosira profunda]
MGKKSKGRSGRRAAKEKKSAEAGAPLQNCHRYSRSLRWNFTSCGHGVEPGAFPKGSACRSFLNKFIDVLDDPREQRTGELFINTLEQTYESHRGVWDCGLSRQLVIADLLRRGADILLRADTLAKDEDGRGVGISIVGGYATAVEMLETYTPERARQLIWESHEVEGKWLEIPPSETTDVAERFALRMASLGCKSKEIGFDACYYYVTKEREDRADSEVVSLLSGCERTILRFYSKRLSCSCLTGWYKAVKHQAKVGICENCGKEDERKKLMMCTGCNQKYSMPAAPPLAARSADGSLVGIQAASSPSLVRCYDGRVSSGSLKFTLRLPTASPTADDGEDEPKEDPLRKLAFASSGSGKGGAPTHLCGMKSTSILVWDLDRGVLSQTIDVRDSTTAGKKKKKRKSSVAGGNEVLCDVVAGNGQMYALIFFPDGGEGEGGSSGKCRVYQYDLSKGAALVKKIKVGSVPAPADAASGGNGAGPFGIAVSESNLIVRMGRHVRVNDLVSGSKLCKADVPGDASSENGEGDSFAPIGLTTDGGYIAVGCGNQAVVFSYKKGGDKHELQAAAQLSAKDDAPIAALDVALDDDDLAVLAFQPSVGIASLFSLDTSKSPSGQLVPQLPQATLETDEKAKSISLIGAGFHPRTPDESMQLLFQQGKSKSGSASGSGTKLPMESKSYADGLEGTVIVGAKLLEEAKGKDGKKRKSESVALAPGDQGQEASSATDLTLGKKKKARMEGASEEEAEDDAFGDLGDEEGEQGQSIAERLALLSSAMEQTDDEDSDDGGGAEDGDAGKPSKFKAKSATSDSLATLLSQALSSNDANQLHVALQVTDRRLVEGTVRALQALDAQRAANADGGGDGSPALLPTLLAHIVRRMARKHSLMMPLGVWVRAILAATARSTAGRAGGGAEAQERMAREGREMAAKLGPLRNLLNERVECFPQLLRLEGRLALLNQQL